MPAMRVGCGTKPADVNEPALMSAVPLSVPTEIAGIVADVTGGAPRTVRSLDTEDGLVVLVTLGLPGETTLAAAHDEASEVEERIRAAFPDIADVVVHTEP